MMTMTEKSSIFTRDNKVRVEKKDLSNIDETREEIVIDDKTVSNGPLELSPLHMFAISGNKKKLQESINNGEHDINEIDNMGRTPLIYSVLVEQMECVMLLLKSGADVDKPDSDGRTALHWAAYQGNHKLVKLIISKSKDKTIRDKEGRTALHLSISHDNIKVMQILLKYLSEQEVDTSDYKSMTALCWSVSYERIEHTKLLLRSGASALILDTEGRSVLHWTSQNKTPILIKLLLEEGCNSINFEDKEGRTLLHMAVGHGSVDIVEYLLTIPDIAVNQQDIIKRTPLHWAAVLGKTYIVELLLNYGADFSLPDNNGARALHYAAQNNNKDVVVAMLNTNKVVDEPDNEKRTALMWASVKGSVDVLKVLLMMKCSDINALDIHQQTALHMSCQAGYLQCVKELILYGADVNIVDTKHHIPLFYACASGHAEIVSELLSHDSMSNLDDRDLEGRTPLHYSAMVDRRDIIKILIQHHLDPNTPDNAGCPPLHIAAYGGFVHCMNVLLENGADVNIQDNDGRTALHMACRSGVLDAVKLLVSRYEANVNTLDKSDTRLTCLDYAFLEDHQDVAFFLIENSANTAVAIKDQAAIKMQAIWRGYYFRKDFFDQKALMVKHEKERKRFPGSTPPNISSNSEVSSTNETMQAQGNPNDYGQHSPQDETALPLLPVLPIHSSLPQGNPPLSHVERGNHPLSHIEVPLRERTKSMNSIVSGGSMVSSRSSAIYLTPDKAKFGDSRQGPKFYDGNTNPFSLNRVSRVLSPYSDAKLFVNPPPKAKSTTGVITHKIQEHPYKRLSSTGMYTGKKFRKHSSKSSTGPSDFFGDFNPGHIEDKKKSDRNSLYNASYSRYVNSDQKTTSQTSGSESTTLFQAQPSHYPLPQISIPQSQSDETSSSQSIVSVTVPSVTKSHKAIPPLQPQPPPLKSKKGFSVPLHNDSDNKPWNIYRRDQKRINIIRLKTEAAIKIQSAYRIYKSKQFVNNHMSIRIDAVKNDHYSSLEQMNLSLSSARSNITEEQSIPDMDSFNVYVDSETDSYDTGFSTEELEEIPDEETLQEVAALVIQAAWRQYVKNKLIQEVRRSKENLNDDPIHHLNEQNIQNEQREGQQKKHEHKQKKKTSKNDEKSLIKYEKSKKQTNEVSFDENVIPEVEGKRKLAPSQSFPLMQNIYRQSLRKKRSKRFSIKKRLLHRTNSTVPTNTTNLSTESQTLASISPNLSRSEIQALKNGKPKLFLIGKSKTPFFHVE